MEKPKDGGPAFPSDRFSELGMSLRDYFAAKAMEGIIANSENITNTLMWLNLTDFKVLNISDACELSYLLADAMLAEREKERA